MNSEELTVYSQTVQDIYNRQKRESKDIGKKENKQVRQRITARMSLPLALAHAACLGHTSTHMSCRRDSLAGHKQLVYPNHQKRGTHIVFWFLLVLVCAGRSLFVMQEPNHIWHPIHNLLQ